MIPLIRMSAGLVLWAAMFSLVYALHGVGCAAGWAEVPLLGTSQHRAVLAATWIGGTALAVGLALWIGRTARDTLTDRAAVRLSWVAVIATFVCGLPVAVVPGCL